MKLRALAFGLAFAAAAILPASSQEAAGAARADAAEAATVYPPRVVMTWFPPYDRATTWSRIRATYGGWGPANALTHLGLQFWKPVASGSVYRVTRYGSISDAAIKAYVDWAHDHGVKVMLTVFNGDPTWDWATAKTAMTAADANGNPRARFVAQLVAEMQKMNLDGVDVDIEGPGMDPTADDKAQYLGFVSALSTAVHAKHKAVQIDSFPWQYNAPNWNWWADLFPLVDHLASMGYEDLGRNAVDDWRQYATQRRHTASSKNMSKLIIGVPSYLDSWQGDASTTQIQWFSPAVVRTGVGIWDGRMAGASWRQKPIWILLNKIRAQNAQPSMAVSSAEPAPAR